MVLEDQATLRQSASSTHSTTGSSGSRPMSSADHVRVLAHNHEDEAMVHPMILRSDSVSEAHSAGGLTQTEQVTVLKSDRVSEAHSAGGLTQTEQVTGSLTRIAQKNGQTLVSAIAPNPSWCFRCCLPLDSASEVPRVRRLATRYEHQWNVRQRRVGSKGGIHRAVLSGDRRQQLAQPVRRDSHADQLCGLFKDKKAGVDPVGILARVAM